MMIHPQFKLFESFHVDSSSMKMMYQQSGFVYHVIRNTASVIELIIQQLMVGMNQNIDVIILCDTETITTLFVDKHE